MKTVIRHEGRVPGLDCTPANVQALLNKGYSQSAIARMMGRSRQRISQIIYEHNLTIPERRVVRKMLPWAVTALHNQATHCRLLRAHLEYQELGGEDMDIETLKRLKSFYQNLRANNLVVEYDPSIPPYDGCITGGWAYRERRPSDGELIIRLNEDARPLTDKELDLWEFPRHDPEV